MTVLMYIAIALAVLIAIVLILAAMRPDTFRVERSMDTMHRRTRSSR